MFIFSDVLKKDKEEEKIKVPVYKNTKSYHDDVKVAIIDKEYSEEKMKNINRKIKFVEYNAESGENKVNNSEDYSHGNRMVEIICREDFVKTPNRNTVHVISVADTQSQIKTEYLHAALDYCMGEKIDIILISCNTNLFNEDEVEQKVNKMVDNGTIVVANQADDVNYIQYPAQYKNVLAVSNVINFDYEKDDAKVDVIVNSYPHSTSELSAYVVNILARTYKDSYRMNFQKLIATERQVSVKKMVKILSK